jgi:hypothetical protein
MFPNLRFLICLAAEPKAAHAGMRCPKAGFRSNRTASACLVLISARRQNQKPNRLNRLRKNGICGSQGLKPLMNPMRLRRG